MPGQARIGLSTYNVTTGELLDLARSADEAGFDSLWLGEHLVLPCGYESSHPTHVAGDATPAADNPFPTIVEATTELTDPMIALAAAAALTSRIRLATGIYILPLRHPLVSARSAATLHDVSGGRFMLGVGAGWLREEFDALGVPFADRGHLQDECLEVIKAALAGGPFHFTGKYFSFDEVQVTPRPVEVPLVLGGNSDRALARAARLADAWFASGTPSLEEAVGLRDRLLRPGRPHPAPAGLRPGAGLRPVGAGAIHGRGPGPSGVLGSQRLPARSGTGACSAAGRRGLGRAFEEGLKCRWTSRARWRWSRAGPGGWGGRWCLPWRAAAPT
jgi:probable F420-dependent oxidoreductase